VEVNKSLATSRIQSVEMLATTWTDEEPSNPRKRRHGTHEWMDEVINIDD
jgi:hypothetical protein